MIYVRVKEGSVGSGNFGHAGRKGKIGGSSSNKITSSDIPLSDDGSMSGYLGNEPYFGVLEKFGISKESEKDIRDLFHQHTFGGESQIIADNQLQEMWDSETETGPLHRISQIETVMANRYLAFEKNKVDGEISTVKKHLSTAKTLKGDIPDSLLYDLMDSGGGYHPTHEFYNYEQAAKFKIWELKQRKQAVGSLYRKTAQNEESKRLLSFTQSGLGANTSPLTFNSRIRPNIKTHINILKKENLKILFGYARQRGVSGEAEVLLIKDPKKVLRIK